jgi:hypothetical protein
MPACALNAYKGFEMLNRYSNFAYTDVRMRARMLHVSSLYDYIPTCTSIDSHCITAK